MSSKNSEDAGKINKILGNTDIEIDDADAADIVDALMGAAEEVRNAPKRRIKIHNQEGPDGDKSVFVAVNGMAYMLPREQVILVPIPIIENLNNAAETKYYREETDGKGFGPILGRSVKRIPFSELGG